MTDLFEKVQTIMEDSMKVNNIPGAAVAVIKDCEVIFAKGFGRTAVEEWGSPIRTDTLFRIASVSKLFTGTLVMMLVEKGLIDLDQPVQAYVPWFTAADQEWSNEITIRMLLSHTSGLPTGGDLSSEHTLDEYMREVVPTLPVLFHPGTAYSYGNHALNIAGFVAEQVTNKPFASLMQELLFEPLKMTQTTYDPLKAMTYPLAMPHHKNDRAELEVLHQFYNDMESYPSYYAFSSIKDLCQFALMHLQEGVYEGQQIISASSLQEMRTQQTRWFKLTDAGCGISFFQESKGGIKRFWHYGQYGSQYSSQFILVPEKGIAVIALANGENIFQAGYKIVDALLDQSSQDDIDSAPSEGLPDLSAYEGTFLHSYKGLITILKDDGNWFLKHNDQTYDLLRHSIDTYYTRDHNGAVTFTVGFPACSAEQPSKCIMINGKASPEFKQIYTANTADWINYEGTFSNGRDTYKVSIQGNSLIIKDQQTSQELETEAIASNLFMTDYGLVSFTEINRTIDLVFDNAWRFPKLGIQAPVIQQ
ncbi:serine hydrolase domain-containing protein [Peribacillus deserti]|uniref:Beta-lactamase-related domain-containing protein n=1 Tax=Peribacillus deserti TaxID=673318 RepID=A0A2N5M5T6_9BACI|nr:serine hydrolase domain-containing protein [Peribacillus deserti]PLT29692.1 hypothetical protein CUU66_11670 [Peribacillus deserti]